MRTRATAREAEGSSASQVCTIASHVLVRDMENDMGRVCTFIQELLERLKHSAADVDKEAYSLYIYAMLYQLLALSWCTHGADKVGEFVKNKRLNRYEKLILKLLLIGVIDQNVAEIFLQSFILPIKLSHNILQQQVEVQPSHVETFQSIIGTIGEVDKPCQVDATEWEGTFVQFDDDRRRIFENMLNESLELGNVGEFVRMIVPFSPDRRSDHDTIRFNAWKLRALAYAENISKFLAFSAKHISNVVVEEQQNGISFKIVFDDNVSRGDYYEAMKISWCLSEMELKERFASLLTKEQKDDLAHIRKVRNQAVHKNVEKRIILNEVKMVKLLNLLARLVWTVKILSMWPDNSR